MIFYLYEISTNEVQREPQKRNLWAKCSSKAFVKSEFIREKQMFLCKNCSCQFTQDFVGKYGQNIKLQDLKLYKEGNEFRRLRSAKIKLKIKETIFNRENFRHFLSNSRKLGARFGGTHQKFHRNQGRIWYYRSWRALNIFKERSKKRWICSQFC